jgi:UDP-MurNAc hydroxylase
VRVTLIGHATLYVEAGDASFLVDPVLRDPFEGGAVSSWPERTVDLEALPQPDFVVISHRHPDHFDIESLALLPRDATVLLPRDPLIAHALEKLGFGKLQPLDPGRPLSFFETQVFPTRSEEPVREVGLVFADSEGAIFDQVDTALSRETAQQVRDRFALSAHFARYASQNFDYFESRAAEFPWQEHARNLETAAMLGAGLVVPGSAGFRFCGAHAWLNRFLFPVSRREFLADLGRVSPGQRAEAMDPGDVVEISRGEARIRRGASPFVRCLGGSEDELRFDPTSPVPPLNDPNPDGRNEAELREGVVRIARALAQWAPRAAQEPLSVPWRYQRAGAVYGLTAVLPGGALQFSLDFGAADVPLREGAGGPLATVTHHIAASALLDWAERRRDFFSVRAWSRRFSTQRRVAGDASGVEVLKLELPDLLMHWLLRESEGADEAARRRVDLEIARCTGATGAARR